MLKPSELSKWAVALSAPFLLLTNAFALPFNEAIARTMAGIFPCVDDLDRGNLPFLCYFPPGSTSRPHFSSSAAAEGRLRLRFLGVAARGCSLYSGKCALVQ